MSGWLIIAVATDRPTNGSPIPLVIGQVRNPVKTNSRCHGKTHTLFPGAQVHGLLLAKRRGTSQDYIVRPCDAMIRAACSVELRLPRTVSARAYTVKNTATPPALS